MRALGPVAVSGTNVYKSIVVEGKKRRHVTASVTSTATGTLKRQVNNMTKEAYAAACGFVREESAVDRAAKEAANDAGWEDESFLMSDATNGGATLSMDGAVAANATVSANMLPGPTRERYVYTNTANSGNLTIDLEV